VIASACWVFEMVFAAAGVWETIAVREFNINIFMKETYLDSLFDSLSITPSTLWLGYTVRNSSCSIKLVFRYSKTSELPSTESAITDNVGSSTSFSARPHQLWALFFV